MHQADIGNGPHTGSGSESLFPVCIDFENDDLVPVLRGELAQEGCDFSTGRASVGIVVDEDQHVGALGVAGENLFVGVNGGGSNDLLARVSDRILDATGLPNGLGPLPCHLWSGS